MEERREQAAEVLELPELEPGMLLEVLSSKNQLIFVGKLQDVMGDTLEITDEAGFMLPYIEFNTVVKLRGFHQSQAVILEGTIGGNSSAFWRVENLRCLKPSERRQFFRQNAGITVKAICLNEVFGKERPGSPSGDQEMECFILDISAGGAMVQVTEELEEGDWLFLMDIRIIPKEPPFALTCRVQRVIQRGEKKAYGCQFSEMEEREQDRLIKSILYLQRKELQARRNRE